VQKSCLERRTSLQPLKKLHGQANGLAVKSAKCLLKRQIAEVILENVIPTTIDTQPSVVCATAGMNS
jgi:hypothetical protein